MNTVVLEVRSPADALIQAARAMEAGRAGLLSRTATERQSGAVFGRAKT